MKKKRFKKEILKTDARNLGNILLASIAFIGIAGIAVTVPNALQLLTYALPEDDLKRHYKYRATSSLQRLIKDKFVQEKIENGKRLFVLTHKGKLRYESLKIKKERRWDGRWRVISFDIYEKKRHKRWLLRRELKAYGFRMIHQSIWAYPFPCDEYIALLRSDLRFGKNLQYMLVDYIDMHRELKERFDL
ncbi:MAG: hypothetical protein V4665_04475 [Patescibacteria group bacterium]